MNHPIIPQDVRFLVAIDTHPASHPFKERVDAIRAAWPDDRLELIDIFEFLSPSQRSWLRGRGESLKTRFLAGLGLETLNARFIAEITRRQFDVLVLCTIHDFKLFLLPDTLRHLRSLGKMTVGVLGDEDIPARFREYQFWTPLFDIVVPYTTAETARFNAIHPNAVCLLESTHMRGRTREGRGTDEKRGSCVYLGSPNPARMKLVEHLIKDGINVHVYGRPQWRRSRVVRPFYRGRPSNEEYDEVLRGYDILLAFLEDRSGDLHINGKVFDAARNRMAAVSSYYLPFLEDYGLVEGVDLLMYRTPEELTEKVRFLLDNPAAAAKMADRLTDKISRSFDYCDLYLGLFQELATEFLRGRRDPGEVPEEALVTVIMPTGEEGHTRTEEQKYRVEMSLGGEEKTEIVTARDLVERGEQIITTPYVVLGQKGVRYQCSLRDYMRFLKNFENFDRAVFLSMDERNVFQKTRRVHDVASVVWQKGTFLGALPSLLSARRCVFPSLRASECLLVPLIMNSVEDMSCRVRIAGGVFKRVKEAIAKLENVLRCPGLIPLRAHCCRIDDGLERHLPNHGRKTRKS